MRALGWFLLAIAGTLLFAALVAYPVHQLAMVIDSGWRFPRIVSRFWQLSMLAGIALCVWRLGLRGLPDWGYGMPRATFLRQFGLGLAAGIATMLPMALAIVALGLRAPRPEFGLELLLQGLAGGALTGLAVALVEESFFRGLMFTAVRRESGLPLALASTALLYSAIHFLARARAPAEIGWGSGLDLLSGALVNFAEPLRYADAFLTLALVGLLLGLVRHWSGAIAACIGLHMGWVWVIKLTTATTAGTGLDAPFAWLVSRFDGFTGWMVAAWSLLMLAAAVYLRRRINGALNSPRA